MDLRQRSFFAPRDILFLVCVVAIAAFVFFTGRGAVDGETYAEISVDGQVVREAPLGSDDVYSPTGRPGVQIAVRGSRVGFVLSDCPDKTCVHSGFLSIPGQLAVCLPNRVVVRVASKEGEELDSTAY
jgi:hypothetical protein